MRCKAQAGISNRCVGRVSIRADTRAQGHLQDAIVVSRRQRGDACPRQHNVNRSPGVYLGHIGLIDIDEENVNREPPEGGYLDVLC